jgi:nickel-dependent lactate racemase
VTEPHTVELPWAAWHRDTAHRLSLPQHWTVEVLRPQDAPRCTGGDIAGALDNPIDSPPLDELARGCRSVCLVVDDLARPTQAADVLTPLLARLHALGLAADSIRIVVATGSHGALTPEHIAWKVGADVAARYRVECHDCRANLAGTGITYGDRELLVNRTFYESDLKLGIGSVLPHSFAGYSGGAKLVLPGLADLQATARSHKFVQLGLRGGQDPNQNRFRTEAEQLVATLGLRFIVCVVANSRRETAAVCAGGLVAAHRRASAIAARTYRTEVRRDYDVAILNAYPKDIDLVQADNAFVVLKTAAAPVVRTGGLYILSTAATDGIGHHGLFEPGGVSYRPPTKKRQLADRDLWIYAPNLIPEQVRTLYWQGYPTFHTAEELHQALNNKFPHTASCAIFPCAPMQQVDDRRSPHAT